MISLCFSCLFVFVLSLLKADAFAARKSSRKVPPGPRVGFGSKVDKLPKHIPDTSPATVALLEFLETKEAEGIGRQGGTSEIAVSPFGLRGLYAKDDFLPGDFICAIPFPATIVIDQGELETDAERGLSLLQKFTGSDDKSEWSAYVPTLPDRDSNFSPTPDFFSSSEIEALELTRLVREASERKQQIKALATAESVDVDELQFATWLVKSRAFTTLKLVKEENRILCKSVLIPYLDMVNHSSDHSNSAIEVIETPGCEDDSFYALQCTRPIKANKEILISYGTTEDTSAELFCNYGFLPTTIPKSDVKLLDEVESIQWSTSLSEDERLLKKASGTMKSVIEFRIRAKKAMGSR